MTHSAATATSPALALSDALALASRYVADLEARHGDEHTTYSVDPTGRKYLRLVVTSWGSRSVHAFLEVATGDLFKAAGWTGPAAGARYHLADPAGYDEAVERSDRFGGYLYSR
jgi:hypothetical protein